MLIGSVACFVLISQDGLSLTCGIKICKALHLAVREIAFEAIVGGAGAGQVLSSYSRGLLTGLTCLAAGHGCYRVRGLH